MTNEQKIRIATLRRAGQGYTAIARELGLSKSAISNYCQKNGLGNIVAETGKKNLLKPSTHGNTEHAEKLVGQRVPAFRVSTVFADEPNEAAVAEALRILANV